MPNKNQIQPKTGDLQTICQSRVADPILAFVHCRPAVCEMTLIERLWNASPRSLYWAIRRRVTGRGAAQTAVPRWISIPRGPLAGRKLWFAPEGGSGWREMADGVFDDELFGALAGVPLKGCTFWDIGAHMGYHSLSFAALGGEGCRVLAFEPNPFNRERLARNLEGNPELASRIEVLPLAVASRDGELDLVLSPDVESGMSSCSHVEGAQPPRESGEYAAFSRQRVQTVSLDSFSLKRDEPPPAVVKIDVEGGEQLVLEGGRGFLSRHKPLILMEVHNIQLMFHVHTLLIAHGYELNLIDSAHSSLSRCFVVARGRE
jgi:FkbM family methyltransferase